MNGETTKPNGRSELNIKEVDESEIKQGVWYNFEIHAIDVGVTEQNLTLGNESYDATSSSASGTGERNISGYVDVAKSLIMRFKDKLKEIFIDGVVIKLKDALKPKKDKAASKKRVNNEEKTHED